MDDEAALLRAIADRPEDDTPRLVFADWLDDHGQPERAELIRVQVAYERGPFDTVALSPEREHIITWSRQLSSTVGKREFPGFIVCPSPFNRTSAGLWATHRGPAVAYFRGLPEARLTLAQLVGGEPCACGIRPSRTAELGLPQYAPGCSVCHGEGTVPGLAAALGKVVGLTGVNLTDREPVERPPVSEWVWQSGSAFRSAWGTGPNPYHEKRYDVPDEIFDLMDGEREPLLGFLTRRSRDAALRALSTAALAFCREAARESTGAASNRV